MWAFLKQIASPCGGCTMQKADTYLEKLMVCNRQLMSLTRAALCNGGFCDSDSMGPRDAASGRNEKRPARQLRVAGGS